MKVQHRMFKSSFKFWNELCNEAAEFASQIPPDLLVSISQSCDHSTGVVVVWYYQLEDRSGYPYVPNRLSSAPQGFETS